MSWIGKRVRLSPAGIAVRLIPRNHSRVGVVLRVRSNGEGVLLLVKRDCVRNPEWYLESFWELDESAGGVKGR